MIYIVSGFMRTGTSMMMHSLIEGGLQPHESKEHGELLSKRWGDEHYQPNQDGFHEPSGPEFRDPLFPTQHDGKVIKVMFGGIQKVSAHEPGYKAVYMWRSPEAIRSSIMAFSNVDFLPLRVEELLMDFSRVMTHSIRVVNERRDFKSVHVFRYERLLENSSPFFEDLASDGWPIDPEKASAVPDPKKRRFAS